jgi:hypothetical protein
VGSSPPTIAGTPTVGQTLSASTGGWSGTPPLSYAYQWQLCSSAATSSCTTNIPGASATTYVLTSADQGHYLRVVVTASNSAGSAVVNSSPVGPVGAAGPTMAAVKAALERLPLPKGKSATIAQLLKHRGYRLRFTAPSAGILTVTWTTTIKHTTVTIATVKVSYAIAKAASFTISLTRAGRRLLAHTKSLRASARESFTPHDAKAIVVSRAFTLKN